MVTAPQTCAADTTPHQAVLNRFVDFGDRLVRLTVERAEAATFPVDKAAAAYDRVTRSVRKSIWLVRKLAEPAKSVDRIAARKQIIRTVEDAIQRHAEADPSETLHEELLDRLDTSELEDEIGNRPVEDIIADILRDLGLAAIPGTQPWKRRTPADLTELHARAARDTPITDLTITTPVWPSQIHPVGYNSS
jgi:hypothetical protein